jgi:hypothetical protein
MAFGPICGFDTSGMGPAKIFKIGRFRQFRIPASVARAAAGPADITTRRDVIGGSPA